MIGRIFENLSNEQLTWERITARVIQEESVSEGVEVVNFCKDPSARENLRIKPPSNHIQKNVIFAKDADMNVRPVGSFFMIIIKNQQIFILKTIFCSSQLTK